MMFNAVDFEKFLEGEFLSVLLKLVIIYGTSVIFSGIAKRFRQPAVLGYIVGGILLGLFLGARTPITFFTEQLGGFAIDGKTMVIYDLSQIGVILLLFMAGLETDISQLRKSVGTSVIIASLGIFVTMVLVGGASLLMDGSWAVALAMGVILASTSVSISVQTLTEMGRIKSTTSVISTGAAIIDDIIGLLLITFLGIFLQPGMGGGDREVISVLLKIFGLFGAIALVGFVVVKLNERIVGHSLYVKYHDQILMGVLAFCFILAYFAQYLGVSVIIGGYFAGLMLSATKLKKPIEDNLRPIEELFFAPLFFMSIGLSLDLRNVWEVLLVGLLMGVLAMAGKIMGCGLGSRLTGGTPRSSLKVGAAMVPRGEVSFISASIASGMGLINDGHMAIAVIVVILTSLFTPTLLKIAYREPKKGLNPGEGGSL